VTKIAVANNYWISTLGTPKTTKKKPQTNRQTNKHQNKIKKQRCDGEKEL